MHGKRALFLTLLVFLLLIVMCPARAVDPPDDPAPVAWFSGNVDNDFFPGGIPKPGVISLPDTTDLGGCDDEPLGGDSFGNIGIDAPPSGFNLERVVTLYDCASDILYIGLDVCDGKLAWDADGDGSLTGKTTIVPGVGELEQLFSDIAGEDYQLELDLGVDGTVDVMVFVTTDNGGVSHYNRHILVPGLPDNPMTPEFDPEVTVYEAVTGNDVELQLGGLRAWFKTAYPALANTPNLHTRISTRSGSTGDLVNEDTTAALFDMTCQPCIEIEKSVSCQPDTGFGESVSALRGADVYFKMDITNCAVNPETGEPLPTSESLTDVVLTDILTEQSGDPLLNCVECTITYKNGNDQVVTQPIADCIPGVINITAITGDIDPGETVSLLCRYQTNLAFDFQNREIDATNVAAVTAAGATSGISVNDGPESVTVNLLVPEIDCGKLVDDDPNFAPDASEDDSPGKAKPTNELNLAYEPFGIKEAFYQFCVENTGEVPVSFAAGSNPNCPILSDDFIRPGGTTVMLDGNVPYLIPGTNEDLTALFRAKLIAQFGSPVLPVGETACIVIGGDGDNDTQGVEFDERVLCPTHFEFPDEFQACGFATGPGICLPPAGGENVSTDICRAKVIICPPCIDIKKYVACTLDGPFTETSIEAIRESTVYFQVVVTNCGGKVLEDVTVTDTMLDPNDALLNCTGCTIPGCIPGVFDLGTLQVGESKSFICTVPTNPNFNVVGGNPDATNCASVVATVAGSTTQIVDPDAPVCATVNVLIPGIACNKLIDDDNNPVPGVPGDPTPPTPHLDLSQAPVGMKEAWYYLYVGNPGEVDLSFAAVPGQPCPRFDDLFLEGTQPGVTGLNKDLDTLFRAALQTKYGSHVMPAGGNVYIVVGGVVFDEIALCGTNNFFPDTLEVCGLATEDGVCGSIPMSTTCSADVTICPPPCISITKTVACEPDGDFGPSVEALRGADVYFKIAVTNCGGADFSNVQVKDEITDANGALDTCLGCTIDNVPIAECIPDNITVGDLAVGQTKTIICKWSTKSDFAVVGTEQDVVNEASVIAATPERGTINLPIGPVSAWVNILIPSLDCDKLVDDDDDPDPTTPGDATPPSGFLNLSGDGSLDVETASYWIQLTNDGEVDIDFTNPTGAECPGFKDSVFDSPISGITLPPGTDVDTMFRQALQAKYAGKEILPVGGTVSIEIIGVQFDESELCPENSRITNTFEACGIAREDDICLPANGGEPVDTSCEATVQICPVNVCITKGVSCLPDGPFLPSATVMRGETVYFEIVVTNCGGERLTDIEVTDVLTSPNLACCKQGGCIPSPIQIPDLDPGQEWRQVYPVPTDPDFAVQGEDEDCTNIASVTAVGAVNGTVVSDGGAEDPDAQARVDLRVPGIDILKLVDDDANPMPSEPGDPTPPVKHLNLIDSSVDIETAWYYCKVTNLGETDLSFACTDQNCLALKDSMIKAGGTTVNVPGEGLYQIPGTDQDLCALFLAALQTKYGSLVMPAAGFVELAIPDPVQFDEEKLCKLRATWPNTMATCAVAQGDGICGTEQVRDSDNASVAICEPVLYQAYPGDSNETNNHYGGYLGQWGDTITSVPGVFKLVPGDNWANFVTAAQQGIPYQLKNVTLIKQTPKFIQCDDVFIERTIAQQGTNNIRLRWPLMYEAPGTTWTLTVSYGTNFPWDDDGAGPHVPGYYHENKWMWKVDATLESLKHLLALLHEVPFATDEVPLISDEVMYPILQAKLDNIIALYYAGDMVAASLELGDFEMDVMDACITVSPREPNPTGPGTGIANSDENPACCKILVDVEYIAYKYGLYQVAK